MSANLQSEDKLRSAAAARVTVREDREARRAAALRENLRRRKAQARGRSGQDAAEDSAVAASEAEIAGPTKRADP